MTGLLSSGVSKPGIDIVSAPSDVTTFRVGDRLRVATRLPVGHYRVPRYVRGKSGVVDFVIVPAAVDNEEEGFGRNAGLKRHYYRIAVPMIEIWPDYTGLTRDTLFIEVFETWLERI